MANSIPDQALYGTIFIASYSLGAYAYSLLSACQWQQSKM